MGSLDAEIALEDMDKLRLPNVGHWLRLHIHVVAWKGFCKKGNRIQHDDE